MAKNNTLVLEEYFIHLCFMMSVLELTAYDNFGPFPSSSGAFGANTD